jgi:hypothetical protein
MHNEEGGPSGNSQVGGMQSASDFELCAIACTNNKAATVTATATNSRKINTRVKSVIAKLGFVDDTKIITVNTNTDTDTNIGDNDNSHSGLGNDNDDCRCSARHCKQIRRINQCCSDWWHHWRCGVDCNHRSALCLVRCSCSAPQRQRERQWHFQPTTRTPTPTSTNKGKSIRPYRPTHL